MKALFLVLFVLCSVFSAAYPAQVNAASAPTLSIGIVDYTYLIENDPDTPKANEALQAERELAQKEYAQKSAILNEVGKKELERQLNQRVEQKRQELLKPISDKIDAAIKAVAEAKKLVAVAYKNTFAYGGVDITQEVANKLKKK